MTTLSIPKAVFVFLLAASLTIWSVDQGVIPAPGFVEDFAIGVVGVTALALGAVFRALAMIAMPLVVLARLLIVPAALILIAWLALKTLQSSR